jgi:hypothetical protein
MCEVFHFPDVFAAEGVAAGVTLAEVGPPLRRTKVTELLAAK